MRGNIHPTVYNSGGTNNNPGYNSPYQSQTKTTNDSPYQLGQNVRHKTFGDVVITDMSGKSDYLQVLVQFNESGPKVLAVKFAKLEVIG